MGSCVSTAAKGFHKRSRGGPKPVPARYSQEFDSWARRSVCSSDANVIDFPTPGNIFDKYKFGKELGRGEFGITHQCFEIETEKAYACKKIPKSKLRTHIDVEDVRREVQIMLHLPEHPNIVAFKEVYEDKDAVYLVMELCKGGELFDRIIAKGHFTERAAANVINTIIEVCKVCHDNGVIHRDLKPENFLYADESEGANLKTIDFGLSTFFNANSDQRFDEIVGSPYYMAPEVLRRNYGPEVDVWSAGVILYILLCGVPPFWAETEEGIARAIIRGELDFERDPWPKVSESAKDLVRGMLDPNPYTRVTVAEVIEHPWIKNRDKIRNVSLGAKVTTRIKQFYLMNKFKKEVLRVVVEMLPTEQLDSMRKTFQMLDTDKNGHLSFEELRDGLYLIGHSIPDHDLKMLMDAADADGNGTLNCEEFLTMSFHMNTNSCDELLPEAFNYFDKNGSGYIERDELREALFRDDASPEKDKVVRDILFDIDLDKDGRISFDEFKTMMKTGMDWKMASRQISRAMLSALSLKMFKDESA